MSQGTNPNLMTPVNQVAKHAMEVLSEVALWNLTNREREIMLALYELGYVQLSASEFAEPHVATLFRKALVRKYSAYGGGWIWHLTELGHNAAERLRGGFHAS